MLKEIKIVDKETGNEIKPDKENLIVVPVGKNKEYVTVKEAEDLVRIVKGQLNILEQQNVSKKRYGKHKENIDCKTGCST